MKTTIIIFLTASFAILVSCKESHNCNLIYVQCLNTCLEQEQAAYETWKNCKEDAREVFQQRLQMCQGDSNQYVRCWMLALQESQILHYKCDSIFVSKISEINRYRYECNANYLACLETD